LALSFFDELKRRNVFKVGAGYLLLGWAVLQIADIVVPILDLPDWTLKLLLFLGVLGFPFAMFFAWAYELTPDGIKKESEVSPAESITSSTGQKLNYAIITLLVVVLSYFIYESRYQLKERTDLINTTDDPVTTEQSELVVEGSSIAVMPFVNMSSDPEQEYFSDGISEEILNVLAKIPNLHVTSRSSAFAFKGNKINISEVAKKLGVNNILEGSVRKSGNKVRITAQLIEAGTDKHLWSETYDRELNDIFVIQDEISTAIVTALKSKLGLDPGVVAHKNTEVNLEAHNEYLKGRFFVEKRTQADLEAALAHFNKALEIEPDYTPAWVGKGWAELFLSEWQYGDVPIEISLEQARPSLERAIQLDPMLPEAYGILGLVEANSLNNDKAVANYKKAIELNPNYADAYSWLSINRKTNLEEAFALLAKAVQLSPMSILINNNYAYEFVSRGDYHQVNKIIDNMMSINPNNHLTYRVLAETNIVQGNYAKAMIAFNRALELAPDDRTVNRNAAQTLYKLGLAERAAKLLEKDSAVIGKIRSHLLRGNDELFISTSRELLPRNENDSTGELLRGFSELHAANYQVAARYFKKSKILQDNIGVIYTYLQVGELELAQDGLSKRKANLEAMLEAGFINNEETPLVLLKGGIAFLEGDINEAIEQLKLAVSEGQILDISIKKFPMYKAVRAHPDWPDLIDKSNRHAAEQREIFLRLEAE